MCKLLIITGIKDSPKAYDFMYRMSIPMSKTNAHGIGYTAVNSKGELFSERWHNNYSFMDYESIMTPSIAHKLKKYERRLPLGALATNYSRFGEVDYEDMKSLTLHTRWATCGREFTNTHPFIDQDTSLIHNGVIRNADVLKVNKISTCDSEAALQTYISQGVAKDATQAKKWLDLLTGSWAFGILSRNSDDLRILDVVRGSSSLYYMEIEGIGRVFTTDRSDAEEVVKDMKLEFIKAPEIINMDSMYRFNAVTGDLLGEIDVKPAPRSWETQRKVNHPYQSGRSGSSNSIPENKSTKRTDTSNQGRHMTSDDDLESPAPDLLTANGRNYCTHKVTRYVNNIDEPFLDRLDVFDIVYDRDLVRDFESLIPELRDYVTDCDVMQGFKYARKLIEQLIEDRKSKVN